MSQDNRPILTSTGTTVPLSQVQSGKIKATVTAQDYGFVSGNYYNVHFDKSQNYSYVYGDGQVDLNTEIIDSVLNTLIWYPD